MKFLKSWIAPFLVALVLGLGINTFVFSTVRVQADVLNEYKMNDVLFANKLNNSYVVGNIVTFKDNGTSFVRKITKIESNNITISDKDNNTKTIDKSSITGKVAFKIY